MGSIGSTKVPQALQSGFASRLRLEQTSLFISTAPVVRSNKRAATNQMVSYAEVEEDFDDDEDDPPYGNGGSFYGGGRDGAGLGSGTGSFSILNGGTGTNNTAANSGTGTPRPDRNEVKRMANKTQHTVYTDDQLNAIAEKEEVLVPIRLNLEYDNYRITDFLLWNANEDVITPEAFATITCADMDLPQNFVPQISTAIRNQLSDYSSVANVTLPDEMGFHVIINLNVNLNKQLYEDKFEWDLGSDITPQAFAKSVVQDLGLVGEFYPAIAHALYEVLYRMKREALEGHLPQEIENYAAFGGEAGWRVDQEMLGEEWAPTVETLSQEEIEKREIERGRNNRRLKRESARMGGDMTDIGGLFGRNKRRRRAYDDRGDSPW